MRAYQWVMGAMLERIDRSRDWYPTLSEAARALFLRSILTVAGTFGEDTAPPAANYRMRKHEATLTCLNVGLRVTRLTRERGHSTRLCTCGSRNICTLRAYASLSRPAGFHGGRFIQTTV